MIGVEVRRSLGVFTFAPLAVVVVIIESALHPVGVWEWNSTTEELCVSAILVVPLVIGLASLQSGLRFRYSHRLRIRQASISPERAIALHYLVTVGWLVAGFLAGFAVFGGLAAAGGTYGQPVWTWLAATTAGILLAASFGYAVGAVLGFRWYLPPLLAMGSYLAFVPINSVATSSSYWATHLYLFTDDHMGLFDRSRMVTLLGQLAWYVALTAIIAVVAMALVSRRSTRTDVTGALLACAVAVAGATGVHAGNGVITEGHASPTMVCSTQDDLRICVAIPFRAALPTLQHSFGALKDKLIGTPWQPTRLQQTNLGDTHVPLGVKAITIDDFEPGYARQAVSDYVAYSFDPTGCEGSSDFSFAMQIPHHWLVGGGFDPAHSDPTSELGRAAARFEKLSAPEKRRTLRALRQKIDDCTLTAADFLVHR